MSFRPEQVQTVTVDSYGTLVDTSSAETALAAHVDEYKPVSDLWRARSLMYTMVGNFIGSYQSFYEMNRDALRYALESHGIELSSETIDEILSVYHELKPFEDVRGGLQELKSAGYEVYVVSNGNPEMLESMVKHAEIEGIITDTISAHEIQTFKPDADIYRHAAGRTGTPIDAIAHVAGPTFDVLGAMSAGMQGVWINRGDEAWDPFDREPDLTITSFHELVHELK